jgi:hypothetical protein
MMANTTHYNKIQIARGKRSAKTPLSGELFYDTSSKGVYLGATSGTDIAWKRIGGFDSLVIKGTVDGSNWSTINSSSSLEPGDAYIVTGSIAVTQAEIVYDNRGNVTRGADVRSYDNFFKNGQVIVFVDQDVSAIPNSLVVEEGTSGWVTLAGAAEANDLENDTSTQPIAAKKEIYDVQSALDHLFNHKIEYIGSFDDTTIIGDTSALSDSDSAWAQIANNKKLLPGEMIIYSGNTVTVTGTKQIILRKNTAIICVGDVTGADVDTTILTIPLGASSASDIDFSFTDNRKSEEKTGEWKTKNQYGSTVTYTEDTSAVTLQNAIDNLHQTKADLNAQGKIPLSQIPNTFVGALQYIGAVDLSSLEAGTDGTYSITAVALAGKMAALSDTDSMEKSGEGDAADIAKTQVDAGDYVIIKSTVTTEVKDEDDNVLTRKIQIKVLDTDGTTLFTVSEGDHVICNNVTYSDAGAITAVKLDHLNTSSAVDAVNGMTAEVDVIGNNRSVQTSANSTTLKSSIDETLITTNVSDHTIAVTAPNAVLAHEDLIHKAIPVGSGSKNLLNSEVSINPFADDSNYKTTKDKTHNTELIGKTSAGVNVTVEFPDQSGKLSVTTGNGTKNRLPKYDADGNLIDSALEHIKASDTAKGVFNVVDSTGATVMTLNYEDLAQVLQYKLGSETITRNFDDGGRTSHDNRLDRDKNLHTLLDDCSTIDGGEWN